MFIVVSFPFDCTGGRPTARRAPERCRKPHHQHVQDPGDGETARCGPPAGEKSTRLSRRRHRSWPGRSSGTGWTPEPPPAENASRQTQGTAPAGSARDGKSPAHRPYRMRGHAEKGIVAIGENRQPMKSAAKPVSAPAAARTASLPGRWAPPPGRKRVTSLGVGIRNRASTTLISRQQGAGDHGLHGPLGPAGRCIGVDVRT